MRARPLDPTPAPPVVGRAEWAAARARLALVEDEIARATAALAAARRSLPAVRVEGTYAFQGPDGPADLPGLFAGRRQLVVVHLMYRQDLGPAGDICPGCAVVADGIGGHGFLRSRDTTLVAVSRARPAELDVVRDRHRWTFPWWQCADDFAGDHGFLHEGAQRPGVAVFVRDGADVLLTYTVHGRAMEQVMAAYAWLDLTPSGRQD